MKNKYLNHWRKVKVEAFVHNKTKFLLDINVNTYNYFPEWFLQNAGLRGTYAGRVVKLLLNPKLLYPKKIGILIGSLSCSSVKTFYLKMKFISNIQIYDGLTEKLSF